MRKDPSWFIGVGGLLCLAISGGALYMSRHPEVATRFAPAKNAQAPDVQLPDEIIDDAPSEPVHFLSEQAIAQEYHRQADLPFNIAPAGTKKADKEENEDSSPVGHTPKNRLPGKITFAEETQESSEFDSLFNARNESDDVKPLNKSEEKREIPYVIEELEGNKPGQRLKVIDEQARSEDDADSDDDDDGVADILDFIGNHRRIINLGLSRMGFPVSFFMVTKCDRRSMVIQTPLHKLLADLYLQHKNEQVEPDAAGSNESGPHFMDYCVDEGEERREMPRAEEEEKPTTRVGLIWGGCNVYRDPMAWRNFLGPMDNSFGSNCPENEPTFRTYPGIMVVNGKMNPVTSINPKAWRAFIRAGIKKVESGTASKLSFAIGDILPFVDDSGIAADESQPIDTIWPLNLLSQPFRGLFSYFVDPNRRMTEMTGQSEDVAQAKAQARMNELITQGESSGPIGYEDPSESKKKRKKDRGTTVSPERVHGGIQ
jgi:hypothetical protein